MLIRQIPLLSCLLLCLPGIGFSACDQEDVKFYLDKGFTQDQITQLCAGSKAEVPDYTPYQQQVIIYQQGEEAPGIRDGFTREERMAIKELQTGADVVGLTVDQDSIQYTVKVCLAVQEGKEYSQRFKACPEVFYRVLRSGLTAVASGKQFGAFGQSSITIVGIIQTDPKQDFDDYPPQFRQQLQRHFSWKTRGNKTRIPVRGNYSVAKLVESLQVLSKASDPSLKLAQQETDGENQAEEEQEPAKKKKRWWNPFD